MHDLCNNFTSIYHSLIKEQPMSILLIIALIAAVIFLVVWMQPDNFCITRSTSISAPAQRVFDQVNNLHRWDGWSPWVKLDPNARTTFEGPPAGVGAVMRWDGNRNLGAGSMTVIESKTAELVRFRLDFLRPFKATHMGEFAFFQNDMQTHVSWSMTGKNSFLGKLINLVMNCDKMVGKQFDKGLADLKMVAELAPK